MIDVPNDNPTPTPGEGRDNKGRFQPGNSLGRGQQKGTRWTLTKEIHALIKGTIGRRGKRCRGKLKYAGHDVSGLSDAECWIDNLDEDQFLKVLTHLLPKGVELKATGSDGEPLRPVIVMYGTQKYEEALTGNGGDDSDE